MQLHLSIKQEGRSCRRNASWCFCVMCISKPTWGDIQWQQASKHEGWYHRSLACVCKSTIWPIYVVMMWYLGYEKSMKRTSFIRLEILVKRPLEETWKPLMTKGFEMNWQELKGEKELIIHKWRQRECLVMWMVNIPFLKIMRPCKDKDKCMLERKKQLCVLKIDNSIFIWCCSFILGLEMSEQWYAA